MKSRQLSSIVDKPPALHSHIQALPGNSAQARRLGYISSSFLEDMGQIIALEVGTGVFINH